MTGVPDTPSFNIADADGIVTVFSFTFFVYEADDIKVYSVLDDVETEITSGITKDINTSFLGGTVTFAVAPADAVGKILIRREVDYEQTTEFANITRYKETAIETALNNLSLQIQQLRSNSELSPKYSESAGVTDLTVGTPVDANVLTFSGVTGKIVGVTLGTLSTSLDAIFTGLAANDGVYYNGTNWVNETAANTVTRLSAAGLALDNTLTGENTFSGDVVFEGKVSFADDGELTISSGAITVTGSNHTVDTEGDAASDDLDTINGGVDGMRLTLRIADDAREVVIKDGTGNIETPDDGDVTLTNDENAVNLEYDAELSKWLVTSIYKTNSAAYYTVVDDDTFATASNTTIPTSESVKEYVDSQSSLTLGTAQDTTSGTAISFTGIPAGTKRVTVSFETVSCNSGSVQWELEIGDSGGLETTGYDSICLGAVSGNSTVSGSATDAFVLMPSSLASSASNDFSGAIVLTLIDESTNTWAIHGNLGTRNTSNRAAFTSGVKSLSAALSQLRITAGGATFDAGKINIMYE